MSVKLLAKSTCAKVVACVVTRSCLEFQKKLKEYITGGREGLTIEEFDSNIEKYKKAK